MELRKDPITQSWVLFENEEGGSFTDDVCPLCPGQEFRCPKPITVLPGGESNWQVRVIPHLRPLYRIESGSQRSAEGIYDKMSNLGAHEIVVEHPDHSLALSRQPDEGVALVLQSCVSRIADLKKDGRFRYVTIFRNQGALAGQELDHPHSQITATPFVPRRVGYELRSCKRYFEIKERCLFCDILRQEEQQGIRVVQQETSLIAFCPFASRVPYETWILPRDHHASFEEDVTSWDRQLQLARFLKRVLLRVESVAPAYHLVLHTSPNRSYQFEIGQNWQTLEEDYHWHLEILPIVPSKSQSYSLKEVYYNSLSPEAASEQLRKVL